MCFMHVCIHEYYCQALPNKKQFCFSVMHSSFMSYMCSLSGVKEDTVCSMIVLSGKRSSVGVAWMFNASSFAGSGDGSLRAWSTETGIEVHPFSVVFFM
jgi:hypothetical protein